VEPSAGSAGSAAPVKKKHHPTHTKDTKGDINDSRI
jgi:hypothetical protein